jgi:hypothetical protein
MDNMNKNCRILQVSKAWLMAVDLEIHQLSDGFQLPTELGTRFRSLTCLVLDNCLPTTALRNNLVEALMELPRLQSLLNLSDLSVARCIIGRTSVEDMQKVDIHLKLKANPCRNNFVQQRSNKVQYLGMNSIARHWQCRLCTWACVCGHDYLAVTR